MFALQEESRRFFDACLRMTESYARSNAGRQTMESTAEEDSFNDIKLLIDLHCALLSKDFLDFWIHGNRSRILHF